MRRSWAVLRFTSLLLCLLCCALPALLQVRTVASRALSPQKTYFFVYEPMRIRVVCQTASPATAVPPPQSNAFGTGLLRPDTTQLDSVGVHYTDGTPLCGFQTVNDFFNCGFLLHRQRSGYILPPNSSGGVTAPIPTSLFIFDYQQIGVSLWILILLFALPSAADIGSTIYHRRPCDPYLCKTCGYDLRATPDRCPECGSIPQPSSDSTFDSRTSSA